jgi:hypothetical protein
MWCCHVTCQFGNFCYHVDLANLNHPVENANQQLIIVCQLRQQFRGLIQLRNIFTWPRCRTSSWKLLLSILGQILFDITNSIADVLTWAHCPGKYSICQFHLSKFGSQNIWISNQSSFCRKILVQATNLFLCVMMYAKNIINIQQNV